MLNVKRVWQAWKRIAHAIGRVQSRIIMTLVYFIALGPFALVLRLSSDPLGLKSAVSWSPLPQTAAASSVMDSIKQQF